MVRIGISLFVKEFLLFGLTIFLGLYSAFRYHVFLKSQTNIIQETNLNFNLIDWVILIIFFFLFFILTRYKKIAVFSFKIFLLIIIFSGTQIILGSFLNEPWNLLLALFFTIVFAKVHNVLIHNLGIILGISGISVIFGLSISVNFGLFLLVVLSFYDIVAVYVTKHMVSMAKRMIESGSVFGFLIPFNFKNFFYNKDEAQANIGVNFMILGSGDVALPLIFLISLLKISLKFAIISSVFSLLGLFLTHLLFLNQERKRAMAALPPIATMTIIGYFVSQFLF